MKMITRRLLAGVSLSHVLTGCANLQHARDSAGDSAEPRPIIAALKDVRRDVEALTGKA
jgi:hypothetical protein